MKKEIPPILGIAIILVISVPIILYLVGKVTSFSEMQTPVIIKTEIPVKDDNYYFDLAIKLDNVSLCNKILEEEKRKECRTFLVEASHRLIEKAIAERDFTVCNSFLSQKEKDDCFYQVGIELNDISACGAIQDEDGVKICKAVISKEEKFCEEIQNSEAKNNCYLTLAFFSKNSSLCNKILIESPTGKDSKILCNAIIAEDPSFCENCKDTENCYLSFAQFLKDTMVCDRIKNPEVKSQCYLLVKNVIYEKQK